MSDGGCAMDLRWHLVGGLCAFSVALLAAALLLVGFALREDVAEEVEASRRLAELMLAVHEAREGSSAALERLLADGRLRHVRVSLERPEMEQSLHRTPSNSGVVDWLAGQLTATETAALRIPLGRDVLWVSADPRAEIYEILRDAAFMLATLLAFLLAGGTMAWFAIDRALRPVRALEDGLQRLAQGATDAVLPQFELREFRRIAHAIERLSSSLADARAAERALARRLIDLQESERRHLSRELHDEFGQSLAAIGAAAAFVERHAGCADADSLMACARDIRTQVTQMTAQVRGLLSELRPHGLEGLGMLDALTELIGAWQQRASGVTLEARLPQVLPELSPNAGLALYRSLQEALTNVLRHSGARRVWVRVSELSGGVCLAVCDDGCGRASLVRPGGGLLGMRERVEMAGGRLVFGNALEGGLRLELWLPGVKKERDRNDNTHFATRRSCGGPQWVPAVA
ncbi:hypothetical protein B4966_08180 [Rhodocyclaceae bacterium]|nr:hypothetical protein B4966_08180 [Rhodocyclaceae bacterium]